MRIWNVSRHWVVLYGRRIPPSGFADVPDHKIEAQPAALQGLLAVGIISLKEPDMSRFVIETEKPIKIKASSKFELEVKEHLEVSFGENSALADKVAEEAKKKGAKVVGYEKKAPEKAEEEGASEKKASSSKGSSKKKK